MQNVSHNYKLYNMPETPTTKSTFENINDLIKAIIWPLIIILLLIIYGAEINQIIKILPRKFENSSKI